MEEFQWMLENYKVLNNLMQTNVICCEDHLNHEKMFLDGCGELQSLLTTFLGFNFQVESVKHINQWIGRFFRKLWAIEKSRRIQSKSFGDLLNFKKLSMVVVSFKANLHPFGGL